MIAFIFLLQKYFFIWILTSFRYKFNTSLEVIRLIMEDTMLMSGLNIWLWMPSYSTSSIDTEIIFEYFSFFIPCILMQRKIKYKQEIHTFHINYYFLFLRKVSLKRFFISTQCSKDCVQTPIQPILNFTERATESCNTSTIFSKIWN